MKNDNINTSVPQPAFSAKQLLENEALVAKRQGISLDDLMWQAGTAVFKQIQTLALKNKHLLIVCGQGNNGGDGFVVAQLAQQAGFDVCLLLLLTKPVVNQEYLTGGQCFYERFIAAGGKVNYCENENQVSEMVAYEDLHRGGFSLCIDAVFGIGFRAPLPVFIGCVLQTLNQLSAYKLAIDLPSGLDATTGAADEHAFLADLTVSFIVHKQGLFTGQASCVVGRYYLAGLQLTAAFQQQVLAVTYLQTHDTLPRIASRKRTNHKGNIGLLLTLGGNKNMPGAISLASRAALRAGAALVSVASHQTSQILVHSQQPELMIAGTDVISLKENKALSKAKMIVLGPGLGKDTWARSLFDYAHTLNLPMVIDADALTLLAQQPRTNSGWVLTPHPGEAAALLSCRIAEIEQNRFKAAKAIVKKYGGICVLKGAGTVITDGEQCWLNTSGNPGMGVGGMGDVLTGIIAALFMQMNDKLAAVRLAVFIHGDIADHIVKQRGEIGLLASDIITQLPIALNKVVN